MQMGHWDFAVDWGGYQGTNDHTGQEDGLLEEAKKKHCAVCWFPGLCNSLYAFHIQYTFLKLVK